MERPLMTRVEVHRVTRSAESNVAMT